MSWFGYRLMATNSFSHLNGYYNEAMNLSLDLNARKALFEARQVDPEDPIDVLY